CDAPNMTFSGKCVALATRLQFQQADLLRSGFRFLERRDEREADVAFAGVETALAEVADPGARRGHEGDVGREEPLREVDAGHAARGALPDVERPLRGAAL